MTGLNAAMLAAYVEIACETGDIVTIDDDVHDRLLYLAELVSKGQSGVTILAHPNGRHYHGSRECPMVCGDDGYVSITAGEAVRRDLHECMCAAPSEDSVEGG